MLAPYSDRVRVIDLEVSGLPDRQVDIALFDTFGAQEESVLDRCRAMQSEGIAERIAMYTWHVTPATRQKAATSGVDGILMKTESADRLVTDLELVAAGHRIGFEQGFEHAMGPFHGWRIA